MRKNNVKITEGMLRKVVKESIINILTEQNNEQTNSSKFIGQQLYQLGNIKTALIQYGQSIKSAPLIEYFQENIFPHLQKAQDELMMVAKDVKGYSQKDAFGENQGKQNAEWRRAANFAKDLQDTGWGDTY